MHKHLISLLLITFFIGSCAPAPASPLPIIATKTQTVISSETPSPTQTEIPTVTPYPPLQTDGPYLLFSNEYDLLTMMDANGIGRKHIELPISGRLGWDIKGTISPDGEWLAYYTGSKEEPYDLSLNLLNISNGTSQLISSLIAHGFPENLEPVTKTLSFGDYDTECESDPKCQLSRVISSFTQSIDNGNALAWSPDSKLLAFAAQIDGPSSDIYIFNTADNSIRRLTDELENIWLISWSPNGDKILYEYSIMGDTYLSRYISIADPNIQLVQHLESIDGGAFWFSYGWVDQNSYLIYNGGEGAPPHRLRIINAETQKTKVVWEYSAESFFVDKVNQIIALVPYGIIWIDEEPEPGVYIVSFNGEFKKISDQIVRIVDGQDATTQYIAFNENIDLIGIKLDGLITPLHRKPDHYVPPRSSPDGQWIAITNEAETEIYSGELQLIKALGIHATDIIWRPDSEGVFLYSSPKLYYLSMDNTSLLEICRGENCRPHDYAWLP